LERPSYAKAIEKTALTKKWVIERLMSFAKCADKDAASVRALELLGKGLGMFERALRNQRQADDA